MGYEKVNFPKNVKGDQLENFFYESHKNVKQCFIGFWARHNVFVPCENNCSKLINADGNWKFGRHICMDKSKVSSYLIISLIFNIVDDPKLLLAID
jgi:hypothetical protein